MAARVLTPRHRLYARLMLGKRDLGWSEDVYRRYLAQHGARKHGGRPSATTMSYAQIEAALAGMTAAGWRRQPGRGSILGRCHPARRAQWGKIVALWCALADAGAVQDRSESAMLTWCASLVREDRLEWAGSKSLARCIEGLRAWSARAEAG